MECRATHPYNQCHPFVPTVRYAGALSHPTVSLQGFQMDNAELLQYKQYLQRYVYAGWEAPDDLSEWVRMLERHILNADMQEQAKSTLNLENITQAGMLMTAPPATVQLSLEIPVVWSYIVCGPAIVIRLFISTAFA